MNAGVDALMEAFARAPGWQDEALCNREGPPVAVWRGENRNRRLVALAKEVCWRCPVFDDCRDMARDQRSVDRAGIWAGESDEDRTGTRGRPRKQEQVAC